MTPNLYIFIAASLALLLTPGPSVLYITTRSVSQGRAAGIASVLGVQLGAMVHVVGAALGLSTIILSSALIFSAVKYLGAAYLIYLGVRAFLAEYQDPKTALKSEPLKRVFGQAFLVAAMNPKTALFFLAFLPQFVTAENSAVTIQLLGLGLLYVGMSCIVDSLYAILASYLRPWLLLRPSIWKREKYVSGFVYLGLGAMAALSGRVVRS